MSDPSSNAGLISLTGIKPTGEPHLGNYVGAIKPAIELADVHESWYFIADFHALTTVRDPDELRLYSRSVGAAWLAAGLDPERTVFYRQSDIHEIFELAIVLGNVTAKGLMNRAHAYKAARDRNRAEGADDNELDAGVNMGLFNYPILMAADILTPRADIVPVGRDQLQHVEYAADIAGSFNAAYGQRYELTVPRAVVPEGDNGGDMPGLDGRKMSKSYNNHIPLFCDEAELRKKVMRIKTDSLGVDDQKDPDTSPAFAIYSRFADAPAVADVRKRLEAGGMGWGELKKLLAQTLNEQLAPMRARYMELMKPGSELDDVLAAGAAQARPRAIETLAGVRQAIGFDA